MSVGVLHPGDWKGNEVNIGETAKASGVSAKMIRHYESVELLPAARRSDSGYRQYSESDVHTLRFIRRARDLGFSINEIHDLLLLWQDRNRPSREVKALAESHLEDIDRKVAELLAMKTALAHLIHCCRGNDRPECPILQGLAGEVEAPKVKNAEPFKPRKGHRLSGK